MDNGSQQGDVSEPAASAQRSDAPSETLPTAAGFLNDDESLNVVRRCFAELGIARGDVEHGDIDTAIEVLPERGWPHFLVVDISGLDDPMSRINRLAEICAPNIEVVVVGEQNDIAMYRDLKAAGVTEYFYKPLLGSLLNHRLAEIGRGEVAEHAARGGRLIYFIGVRGGVGTTTIATNLAWYFAEARRRGVLLLDLDLHAGDAALQLGAEPRHALREALDEPKRIDDLFLERGVVAVTNIFSLLAGLEPLSDRVVLHEGAVFQLLQKLLAHYRYVIVDLPAEFAISAPSILQIPSAILLVSDGTLASAREVARWREFLGPAIPERSIVHVINKTGADGALPEDELRRVIPPPDVAIPWHRAIMKASVLGTEAVQKCNDIRTGMAELSLLLSGAVTERDQSLWKRIFS